VFSPTAGDGRRICFAADHRARLVGRDASSSATTLSSSRLLSPPLSFVLPPALAARAAVLAFRDELLDLVPPDDLDSLWLSPGGRDLAWRLPTYTRPRHPQASWLAELAPARAGRKKIGLLKDSRTIIPRGECRYSFERRSQGPSGSLSTSGREKLGIGCVVRFFLPNTAAFFAPKHG
jgi:hypothetical protein